ncbi:MAG: hypothetical protein ACR2G5_13875 [Pyrinomonadaceae bacterium]
MQKVDRLGWAAGFSLKSYGVRIGIRSNDPACLERVREHLPHNWENVSSPIVDRLYSIVIGGEGPRPNIRRLNLLYGNHVRLARSFEVEEVFNTLESDLRLFVAELARGRVFVHAGVVGWQGRAVVVPGRSFSGKSTLVAELVRAGATYYSDEYAVFDSRGHVHPFPGPLQIRQEGGFKQTKIDVAQLGGRPGSKPLPVGLVLVTHFKKGARWRPRNLSSGAGALELLSNTVSARRSPANALDAFHNAVARAQIVKGDRGEAHEIVPFILEKLGNNR